MSFVEVTALLSTVAAAIAAVAALATVLQNRRLINATLRPRLTGVILASLRLNEPGLTLHNVGGAVAIVVSAVWVAGNRLAEGEVGPGIAPGESVAIIADLPKEREALAESHGVLLYYDALRNWYANSLDGHEKVWRNRWWKRRRHEPDLHDLYVEFYGVSIEASERVRLRVARRAIDALLVDPPEDESAAQ